MNIFIILFILLINVINIFAIYKLLGKDIKNKEKNYIYSSRCSYNVYASFSSLLVK